MLNSSELQELYEGLKLNSVNQYDYVLTGKGWAVLPTCAARGRCPHGGSPCPLQASPGGEC